MKPHFSSDTSLSALYHSRHQKFIPCWCSASGASKAGFHDYSENKLLTTAKKKSQVVFILSQLYEVARFQSLSEAHKKAITEISSVQSVILSLQLKDMLCKGHGQWDLQDN